MRKGTVLLVVLFILLPSQAFAKLGNKVNENKKQFGEELVSQEFSEPKDSFSGKKIYNFPLFGWQLEVIYRDGKSFSETARPKGNKIKKQILTEKEANVISDVLYPKKERGHYRKQIKNANFLSHFFDNGVVSYEMRLDKKRKHHIGVTGVRTILYSNGSKFKDIKVNAYH